eukprot:scaffold287977_cov83-Cyclotella_meneghiniana.AAC.2
MNPATITEDTLRLLLPHQLYSKDSQIHKPRVINCCSCASWCIFNWKVIGTFRLSAGQLSSNRDVNGIKRDPNESSDASPEKDMK